MTELKSAVVMSVFKVLCMIFGGRTLTSHSFNPDFLTFSLLAAPLPLWGSIDGTAGHHQVQANSGEAASPNILDAICRSSSCIPSPISAQSFLAYKVQD